MKLFIFCLCVATIWAVPLVSERKAIPIKKHFGGRIIGGDVAQDGQFPWQVAVYFDTSNGSFFCGGALIDTKWVLTAGHCVYHATAFTLHLGSNTLVDADPNRVTLGASHSVAHPDYKPSDLENDIGLIRIDTAYETNDHIQVIPLATSDIGGAEPVTVSGWGASGDWDGVVNELNFVGLKTITNDECKAIYGEQTITDGMVCTVGETNEGTCNGDSGGPLVTGSGDKAVHVGIVSWASASGCETNHPSGYTRTAKYYDWIKSVVA
ncbi:brachyurin-like [Tribolium madens]|uniref:brachyurin-like n=1 Tax=Tribolium madens TaxID=41895 RepID=UPI001CF7334B|nr:brachyurin-like [Tribolium madens]